jgi:hypothetical protein
MDAHDNRRHVPLLRQRKDRIPRLRRDHRADDLPELRRNGQALVTECLDCAALIPWDEACGRIFGKLIPGVNYRPLKPRPIHPDSGPRSPRCATHRRAWLKAAKQRASDKRSRDRSGLDEDARQAVLAEQGGVCGGCGRSSGRRMNLDADHDHDQAAEHEHGDDVACEDCMRGYLCRSCTRDIIGMLRGRLGSDTAVAKVLRQLSAYLACPPAQVVKHRRAYAQRYLAG